MKWSREGRWITGGFGLILVLMSAVSITSYQNATQSVESANQVLQTNDILEGLTDISAALANAETRRWRYILFGDIEELERFNVAVQSLDSTLDRLRQMLTHEPIQRQRFNALESLVAERVKLFEQSIEVYRGRRNEISASDPLIVQTQQNQDEIRQLITVLEATEEELLEVRLQQAQSNLQSRMVIEAFGTLLTFGVLFGVYALLYRQMVKRQQAEALQQTLAQAKELSELKLQLFSMVSHEFRTPLSLILGSAQLLDETLKHDIEPTKLKNLYRIQSSARMMTKLLNDILMLARADAGKLEYNPEWVEIQTFCLNLVEDFQLVEESGRSLKFTQVGNCTHVYVDEKLLYSILSNLLSNAIKFSPPQGTIHFTLICEPDAVTFQVKDEGIGIPPEDLPKLYDLFTRASNVREIMGTGLGLAVVKKCLELHQGEISVDSQVGAGTAFTVRIPQGRGSRE
ncbi:MAG: histidine kinase [Cyanobacteria bacterium CRU_2_1]|nr:histidine kinase [Cyanobacteria bacterium RU_5_0]NJR57758.1 histidine kinase [Cyanobacteria bacterium CRU_2_1]